VKRIRVVAAAIVRDGRVLAARRGPGMSLPGMWEFPGGKVEPGEDDAAALVRELREELAIDVQVLEFLAVASHDYPHLSIELALLLCRTDDEPVAHEHDALRWLNADALRSVDWAPADVPLLPAVLRQIPATKPS
jgi:8-oxo-dGTP diphosphatase